MSVLIVEDQTEVRNTLSALVESLGFEVDLATNTTDGLAMLSDDSEIGVVLLDLGLPPDGAQYEPIRGRTRSGQDDLVGGIRN